MLVKRYEPFNDIRKSFDLVNAIMNSVAQTSSQEQEVMSLSNTVHNSIN